MEKQILDENIGACGEMIELLIIPYMAITSGWSGGSLKGHDLFPATWMPEALFALGFSIPPLMLPGWWKLLAIPCVLWSYAWQQSSPAPALHWGSSHYNPDKKSTLKPFVDAISPWHPSTKNYCRLYIGIKGLLITLTCSPIGLIGYPIAYELGNRTNNHTVSECLAGAFAGLGIVCCLFLLGALGILV